jgi:membrane protein YdbS with pleckstrin-like domain
MLLRPSTKFITLGYMLCLILAVGIAVYLKSTGPTDPNFWWLLIIPAFLAAFVVIRHIKRRLMKLEILGDRLRYESGFLSKTTETVELIKVQDVRVHQSFGQRLVGIGDISFETAGGSSRIAMHSVDRPQLAADHILELAKAQRLRPDAGQTASHGTP